MANPFRSFHGMKSQLFHLGALMSGWKFWPTLLRGGLIVAILIPLTWALPQWQTSQAAPVKKATGTKAEAQDKEEEGEEKEAAADGEQVIKRISGRKKAIKAVTARGQTIEQAPAFKVKSPLERMEYFPCDDCHEQGETNKQVRELEEEHETLVLDHGGGRFWCYDACHNEKKMTTLKSLRGIPISYEQSYNLCGQCHFQRQKDWYFGGHGKRVGAFPVPREIPADRQELAVEDRETIGRWQGERIIHLCTDCHNPHSPAIRPYQASPPPPVRAGLQRPDVEHADGHPPVWERKDSHGKE